MNVSAPVRPFPFDALPSVSREEIALGRRLRAASRAIRPDAVADALADLSGEVVSIAAHRARPLDLATIPSTAVAVAFAPPDAPGMGRAVIVDVELPLANALISRALRQRVPRVTDSSRTPAPEVAGAFAALLHTALRRAHADHALRVIAAGPAPALTRDLAGVHHRIATMWLTVIVGGGAFAARVSIPLAELPSADANTSPVELAALGDAPLALPLVLATCIAGRSDLAGLRPGDAFLLPRPLTAELRSNGAVLTGPVTLAPARSERGLTGVLALAQGAMLRIGGVASLSWDRPVVPAGGELERTDPPMSGELNPSPAPTLEVLEDAPLVVRVELGVVEMKARDWAELAPGDVVTLGRRLGDPASLRVGGVEIARGELVQVDGEYGVRIIATSMSAGRERTGGT